MHDWIINAAMFILGLGIAYCIIKYYTRNKNKYVQYLISQYNVFLVSKKGKINADQEFQHLSEIINTCRYRIL